MPYRVYQPSLHNTPLQKPYGFAWGRSLGLVKDFYMAQAKQAVFARFPSYSPADGLGAIGDERQIDQGIQEANSAYAQRVRTAWDAWYWGGTFYGMLKALSACGYTAVAAQALKNAYSLDGNGNLVITPLAGNGWKMDATQAFWSKFTLMLVQPLPAWWLTGAWNATTHSGTGAGTVSISGTATKDYRILMYVTGSGVPGVGTCSVSLDNGQTFANYTHLPGYAPINNVLIAVGGFALVDGNGNSTGLTMTFSGSFVAGDIYAITPVINVPGNGSNEQTRIKTITKRWQGAWTTLSRYVIHTSGFLYGWPQTDKYGLPVTGGTPIGSSIFYGNGSATYWSP